MRGGLIIEQGRIYYVVSDTYVDQMSSTSVTTPGISLAPIRILGFYAMATEVGLLYSILTSFIYVT